MAGNPVRVRTGGLRELGFAIEKLSRKTQTTIARSALAAGGRVFAKEMRQRVPVLDEATAQRNPGTVKKNIRVRVLRPVKAGEMQAVIGIRSLTGKQLKSWRKSSGQKGAANPDDPFYWYFVEFGTNKMAAQPFVRPSFDTKKEEAAARTKEQLKTRIEQEAGK
ncbi:HK97-gp10 family putative phage morphogenesis protein [Silvimonas sp.]|uniref:HK97-gp10 family putative phage morphogenesis protein n=1 Tax=Silvimonas sp. TaxID=2650811 RepID=UPI00284C0DFF|nr:HK97-gp10 family putative phage morphogenesis protein [Silvimonas sp.]MDR3427945.1 HK97 gp10 family phage protein [Silvimonas sp.]